MRSWAAKSGEWTSKLPHGSSFVKAYLPGQNSDKIHKENGAGCAGKIANSSMRISIAWSFVIPLALSGCGGGSNTAANPDPTLPSISVTDSAIIEGDSGASSVEFDVSLSETSGTVVSVTYSKKATAEQAQEEALGGNFDTVHLLLQDYLESGMTFRLVK